MINKLIKIAKIADQNKNYKLADKITTALMKKQSMFFLLQAIEDGSTLNALVNALYEFYERRDLDYIINENDLRVQDQKAISNYYTSDIQWQNALDDLEHYYKPKKSLDDQVEIKGTLPDDRPIKINGQNANYYELKEMIIALCNRIENTRSNLFETNQKLKGISNEFQSMMTPGTIKEMEKSGEPIPEE